TRALDDAITNCGGRDDLHQPERALRRHCTGLERRFDGDDRHDERRIERARSSALFDQRGEATDVWMADDATVQRRLLECGCRFALRGFALGIEVRLAAKKELITVIETRAREMGEPGFVHKTPQLG